MRNPILDVLGPRVPHQSRINQMYRAYQAAENPEEYLQEMIRKNPILSQIVSNGNLEQTFYQMCKQRGVNPQDIINDIQR